MATRRVAAPLRRILLRSPPTGDGAGIRWGSVFQRGLCSSSVEKRFSKVEDDPGRASISRWKTLPPVPLESAVRALENIQGYNEGIMESNRDRMKRLTAVRWVAKCCPDVPHSLISKLFRLRQIRMQVPEEISSSESPKDTRLVRVSAKDTLEEGAVLCIPAAITQNIEKNVRTTQKPVITAQDVKWLRSLILHKDKEIIVINKPSGLAVQGGSEVVRSLDSMMGAALSYDYNEGPRLVHRLDKETSGALVVGRTHQSTVFLQALLRDKTAKMYEGKATTMERCYWALVIGVPEAKQGRISAPLAKVVTDNGKLDKMRVVQESHPNAQEAITDYKVLGSSVLGCSWLELRPLTGRKHQIRVHLAEVLNMPIVGDHKYGWQALKVWPPNNPTKEDTLNLAALVGKKDSSSGHVLSSRPQLHLHCRQLTLPNVAKSFSAPKSRGPTSGSGGTISGSGGPTSGSGGKNTLTFLDVVAALPPHMVLSWNLKPLDGFPVI